MASPWSGHGDTWDSLPTHMQASILACGAESWSQVYDGIASHNTVWRPIRPPMLTASTYQALHELADRLAQLILESCQRRAATVGELRRLLDVPEGQIELLDDAQPLSERLLAAARPDVVMAGGVPRFVEFNIDGALGGAFDSDTVAARFIDLYRKHDITRAIDITAAPSAVDGRFAAIRTELALPDGARVAMVMDLDSGYPGTEDPQRFLAALAPVSAAARKMELDLVPYPVSWLQVDAARRLLVEDRPVDAVFRLFVPDKVPSGPGLEALETAIRAGTVRIFTPSAAWLLGNKQVLGWLWADADDLPAADRELIRRHIPHTTSCTDDQLDRAIASQADLVLKPTGGSGGVDVLIGREVSAVTWRVGLDRALQVGGHILQDYIESDGLAMHFANLDTGETVAAEVPYCLGPYLFGRRACGAEVRFGFPGGGSVMNLDRGVLVSGVLLVH